MRLNFALACLALHALLVLFEHCLFICSVCTAAEWARIKAPVAFGKKVAKKGDWVFEWDVKRYKRKGKMPNPGVGPTLGRVVHTWKTRKEIKIAWMDEEVQVLSKSSVRTAPKEGKMFLCRGYQYTPLKYLKKGVSVRREELPTKV